MRVDSAWFSQYNEGKFAAKPAEKQEEMLMSTQLAAFQEKLKELNYYDRVCTLLSWDLYTQTPREGFEGMADAMTFFSTKAFEISTSDEFLQLLSDLRNSDEYTTLDEGMQFTIRTMLRDLVKERRIPKDFYEEFTALTSASMKAWEDAKRSADYSVFAPYLAKIIDMTIQRAAYTDPGKEVYDVLLDQYEEGMDSASIDRVFEELKEGLLPLLDRILSSEQPKTTIYDTVYDPDAQKKVQKLLLEYIGFSFDAGTTGESEHPFTTGFDRHDVRVTNHFRPHDPVGPMFSAIHEGGHAIFDQNTAPELEGTAADSCSHMGLHESQSRFMENILGRRKSFWIPIWPKVQELLPDLKKISLDEFVREINHVKNSFIRTEADEVTYCLHVILRYEIEQEIFRNHARVEDLPDMWNEKMQAYLHLTPENDAQGILQDMHWSDGSFGYFPSYLLGSIYDGMFLEAMEADLGDIDELLENGKISVIREWLSEKIHRYGNLRTSKEVLQAVCGKELSAKPLLRYFTEKYTAVYNISG